VVAPIFWSRAECSSSGATSLDVMILPGQDLGHLGEGTIKDGFTDREDCCIQLNVGRSHLVALILGSRPQSRCVP
jgi:hypothetical protein